MRYEPIVLAAAVCAVALPAANEYDECQRDDLYRYLEQNGTSFCDELLDPECFTSISTPIEYATYDASKLSSYVSTKSS